MRQVGRKYLIFRMSWVYGPYSSNFLLTMLRLSRGCCCGDIRITVAVQLRSRSNDTDREDSETRGLCEDDAL